MIRARVSLSLLCAVGAGVAAAAWYVRQPRADEGADAGAGLAVRLQARQDASTAGRAPCPGPQPLVLLALGQSNAGNHGPAPAPAMPPVAMLADDGCVLASEPLPGATGRGASLWSRLPAALRRQGVDRPVLLRVLAVDSSSLSEWTTPGSPLRDELLRTLAVMRAQGHPPELVLWQQGEADANRGTPPHVYREGLRQLGRSLAGEGGMPRVLPALSTRCRGEPTPGLRAELSGWRQDGIEVGDGPDTDTLSGPTLRQGCHFSFEGLDAAAELWAEAIARALTGQAGGAVPRPENPPRPPAR